MNADWASTGVVVTWLRRLGLGAGRSDEATRAADSRERFVRQARDRFDVERRERRWERDATAEAPLAGWR